MSEKYDINYWNPGKVLVFADGQFERESKLKYIQSDIGLISRVFGSLNYKIEVFIDLTSDQLRTKILQETREDFTDYSCLVCFFSTHGDLHYINDKNGQNFSILEILLRFLEVESLSDKPKFFFIDAGHASMNMEITSESLFELDSHSKNDILIEYTSTTNYESDSNNEGSLFIQKLCKSIGTNKEGDILEILSTLNSQLMEKNPRQLASFDSSLKKKFFFQNNSNYFFKCAKTISIRIANKDSKDFYNLNEISCLKVIDQNLIAIGSCDRTIKIWDLKNSKWIKSLYNSTKTRIKCIQIIDHRTIASGCFDNTVKIWKNNQCVGILHDHKEWIFCLELIDENLLASGSGDKTIKIWDLKNHKPTQTLNGHGDFVYCLRLISQDVLASGSGDKTVKIWNCINGLCIRTLSEHTGRVLCVEIINQDVLASGSADRTIKIWNWKKSTCLWTLSGHADNIFCLKLIDKETLASGSGDRTIKVWNLKYFKCIQILFGHSEDVLCLDKIDNKTLVSGGKDGEKITFNFFDECLWLINYLKFLIYPKNYTFWTKTNRHRSRKF
ncbi:hypothetical protein BpHYR1_052773 [Brachionus plicatilis]|uniref:Caspase family p20 domain-containing protein n=1 Tax=Brachionus plicatilis TaxID=10195 RepID=A0A3M7T0V9_BRAPC|nr:hypothetical protein BpHYR1_052773 [Brachionus plicatilis]